MQSVGQKLRAARLAQGCTLEQIHSSTRISLHTLEAIEADDVARISSAFLYRSFVRQMAAVLNVDSSELGPSMDASAQQIPEPVMPGRERREEFMARVPGLPVGKRGRARWLKPVGSFAVALVACSGLYALWQKQQLHVPAFFGTGAGPVSAPAPPNAGAQNTSSTAMDSSRETHANGAGFTLQLSATEPAWLQIVADGKVSFRGILERAETKTVDGYQTARVRTGNAGALEAVFNGKPIGALGSRGQVRTVVFTRDDYEVLDSSPKMSLLQFNQNVAFVRAFRPERAFSAAF